MTVVWLSFWGQIRDRAGSAWSLYNIRDITVVMEEPLASPQQLFVLSLLEVNHLEAVLCTVEGTVVIVPVFWPVTWGNRHVARLFGGTIDRQGNPLTAARECQLFLQNPESVLHDGTILTMKQLGILARRALGLPGRTPLEVSVRVIMGTKVLGIHQPLGTLMDQPSCEYSWANQHCHCCQQGLWGPTFEYTWANPRGIGPFANCYFCGDSPSWHHGWCCPHNPQSNFYRGSSHTSRYHDYVRRQELT